MASVEEKHGQQIPATAASLHLTNMHELQKTVSNTISSYLETLRLIPCYDQDGLPNAVKRKLEADVQQAQSIAIVITLLAGTVVTLTSILGGTNTLEEDNNTRGWSAFRVILWTAIMSDMGEAIVCIIAIKMCSELPLVAIEKQMELLDKTHESSRSIKSSDGETERKPKTQIGLKELKDRHALFGAVGMPRSYRYVGRLVIWFLVFSVTMSFVTMFFWVCHTIILIPAMLILISFVLIVALILGVFLIAMHFGKNWS